MRRQISIATEDELSEVVAIRLIQAASPDAEIINMFRWNGFGYLRVKLSSFNQIAKRAPVLLLTDLDRGSCAPSMIKSWKGKLVLSQNLLFRVAVRETEAWLLADHEGMEQFLGKRIRFPDWPDALEDPKRTLVQLARKAPLHLRRDLCPEPGAITSQGIGYNSRLSAFVRENWCPGRAAGRSNSLDRAIRRITERLS